MYGAKKICIEHCLQLGATFIARQVVPRTARTLTWSRRGEAFASVHVTRYNDLSVHLSYIVRGENIEQDVRMNTTPLPWDRVRYWWTCPRPMCGRRVKDLYLPPGGEYFACRHCCNLAYYSNQTENSYNPIFKLFRLMDKQDKVVRKRKQRR